MDGARPYQKNTGTGEIIEVGREKIKKLREGKRILMPATQPGSSQEVGAENPDLVYGYPDNFREIPAGHVINADGTTSVLSDTDNEIKI